MKIPQMAPINWLSLFFIFSITFMMFNIINYFSFNTNKKNLMMDMKKNKMMYWKW